MDGAKHVSTNTRQLCKVHHDLDESRIVMTLNMNKGVCSLVINSKEVLIQAITTFEDFVSLLQRIDMKTLCPGIKGDNFFPLINKHNGKFFDPYG